MSFIIYDELNYDDEILYEFQNLFTSINIPEKIKASIQKININKYLNVFKTWNNNLENELIKAKIDVKKLKSQANKTAKTIKRDLESAYKKNIPPSQVSAKLKTKIFKSIDVALQEPIDSLIAVVGESVALTIIIFYINTLSMVLLAILFGSPHIAIVITSVFIAPVLEEYVKYIALKRNIKFGFIYTSIFASLEFVSYIVQIGISTPFIIARLITFLFHMSTTSVQSLFIKDENISSFAGYIVAVILHMTWNSLSLLSM